MNDVRGEVRAHALVPDRVQRDADSDGVVDLTTPLCPKMRASAGAAYRSASPSLGEKSSVILEPRPKKVSNVRLTFTH